MEGAVDTICDYLLLDHKRCDELFTRAENHISQKNWQDGDLSFRLFHDALKQHMRMEEKVLFPAFEQAIRNSEGPLSMLRMEHGQIRGMVNRMSDAVARMDPVEFLIHSETYTLLSQQHSMKEEEMLYPLLDKILFLSAKREQILHAMTEFREPRASN
jgi:hemerythrin-like domain-containing protein